MISELTDEEFLEYLMTSDFIEEYRPEEYKFMLHKFRYFYRIIQGNFSRTKGEREVDHRNLSEQIEHLNNVIKQEQTKNAELQNKIDLSTKERKLTWKERWDGKIKRFDDQV